MSETFVMKCKFENIFSMTENEKLYSEEEVHGGVPWDFWIRREKNHLGLYLSCNRSPESNEWSVGTEVELKMDTKINNYGRKFMELFGNKVSSWGYSKFLSWEKIQEELKDSDGCLDVEVHLKIVMTTGLERAPLKSFDKDKKECSDTILVVKGKKFYVSKMLLASQSSHFKSLLVGDEPEKHQSFILRLFCNTFHAKSHFVSPTEVILEDVDPDDFQVFLEVLYGEPAINDDTIHQLLLMSEWFQADTVTRRCEEFLCQKSEKHLKKMFDFALTFNLDKLKKHCVQSFKSISEMRSAIPSDLSRIDRDLLEELFRKSLTF